jgi:hypothetical protein
MATPQRSVEWECWSAPSPWHVTWPIYGLAALIQYYLCATPPSINILYIIIVSFITHACPIIESYRNVPVRERTGTVKIIIISLIIQLIMYLNKTSSDMRKMIAN